jgi:hypothetical protein
MWYLRYQKRKKVDNNAPRLLLHPNRTETTHMVVRASSCNKRFIEYYRHDFLIWTHGAAVAREIPVSSGVTSRSSVQIGLGSS